MRISTSSIKLGALATGGTFALALALTPQHAFAQGATCGTYAAGTITQPAQGAATGTNSTACGNLASATGTSSTANGDRAFATGDFSTAIGDFSAATAAQSV